MFHRDIIEYFLLNYSKLKTKFKVEINSEGLFQDQGGWFWSI